MSGRAVRRARARARAVKANIAVIPMSAKDFNATNPVLKIVGHGRDTFVWVGDEDGRCYATIPAGRGVSKLAARFTAPLHVRFTHGGPVFREALHRCDCPYVLSEREAPCTCAEVVTR